MGVVACVTLVLVVSSLVLVPPNAAAATVSFDTTSEFDAGTKSAPGDGNLGVETRTDNPAMAADRIDLASVRGDSFTTDDADADTWKWDVPATCTVRSPTTIVRNVSGGALHLGANKATDSSHVGVVLASPVSGDIDVRVKLGEVRTQANSRATFQVLNEHRCYYKAIPLTADGVEYRWDEGTVDNAFLLKVFRVTNGAGSQCGTTTTVVSMDPVFLRIARVGTTWSFYYSPDGAAWTSDESCVLAVSGGLYPNMDIRDIAGGVVTEVAFDDFQIAAGVVAPGGFRAAGNWISPPFDVPGGEAIDRVEISGTFDATYALDRTEIRRAGAVLATFEEDNLFVAVPTGEIFGSGLDVRLYLKGDTAGTPSVSKVELFFRSVGPSATESIAVGSSSGTGNQHASDDLRDSKTKGLGGVESTSYLDLETVAQGITVSGSVSDLVASDDVSVNYREVSGPSTIGIVPTSQTLGLGKMDAGTFPDCLAVDAGDNCVWSEGASPVETSVFPTGETVALGTRTAGTYPTDLVGDDDVRVEYEEGSRGGVAVGPVEPSTGAGLGHNMNDNVRTVWRNPRGTHGYYVVYEDLTPSDLVYRSSADGLSWSAAQLIDADSPRNFEVAIHDTGTELKVFLVVVEGTAITFRRGTIADGSDTISWDSEGAVATAAKRLSRDLSATIARTANGRLVVAYTTDILVGGKSYRTTRLIGSDGDGASPTWSGDVLWDDPSGSTNNANKDQVMYSMAAFNAAFPNKVIVGAHVPDGTATSQYKMISAAPLWDGTGFTNTARTSIRDRVDPADDVSCLIDVTEVAHCLVEDASDLFSARAATPGTDSWEPLVLAVPPADESGKSTLSIDMTQTPNILYAIYDKSTSGTGSTTDLFLRTTPVDTISWSVETKIVYPRDVLRVTSAIRDSDGGIHVAGTTSTNLLFYLQIAPISTASEFLPSAETVLKGAISSGSNPFPGCVQSSDGSFCGYDETDANNDGNFQVQVKYGWSGVVTSGLEWRLLLEGRQATANPETIDVRIYGSDESTLTPAACSLVSTVKTAYDCGALTTDQLDGGSPDILFVDAIPLGDGAASGFLLDRVSIRRAVGLQFLEVRYAWSGVLPGGSAYELRVQGQVSDEAVKVQVLTPPSTWTTRLTLSSTVDVDASYALTLGEFNAGSPSVRFVDAVPGDSAPSFLRLDWARIVKIDLVYALSLEWEWTASITPTEPTVLNVSAALSGAPEDVLVDVWDWQDSTWRAAFAIASSTETTYATTLATACVDGVPGDCEVSSPYPGSVRVRFRDAGGPDPSKTTIAVDLGVVRSAGTAYVLDVQFDWTSIGHRSGADDLQVEGHRGDENFLVQVWDWDASTWTTRLTVSSTADALLAHPLADAEVSSTFEVRIRFIGLSESNGEADGVASDLFLDYVAIEKHEYRLDIVTDLAGISGSGPFVLRLEGRLVAAGDNFGVWIWDWTAGTWTLWIDSAFTTSDQTFERTLLDSEILSGQVRIRYLDDGSVGNPVPAVLEIDLLGIG